MDMLSANGHHRLQLPDWGVAIFVAVWAVVVVYVVISLYRRGKFWR
ncbi:hypothetical protein GA0115240_16099 [Streptomyces sp. DvalAA-14]|nr:MULTISPECIES: hypothetical protein [unclassified Streptomyces]MYS24147.1 hypothetical protein [Streptomyces sp. SID4948]SCE43073.1 hypothetical protein GA0115240_16099 [Streptomyces sp. DvalAA-14]